MFIDRLSWSQVRDTPVRTTTSPLKMASSSTCSGSLMDVILPPFPVSQSFWRQPAAIPRQSIILTSACRHSPSIILMSARRRSPWINQSDVSPRRHSPSVSRSDVSLPWIPVSQSLWRQTAVDPRQSIILTSDCRGSPSVNHFRKLQVQVYDILPPGGRCQKALMGVCHSQLVKLPALGKSES